MALSDVTADEVLAALAEYDLIGQASFLKKYGFRQSRSYVLSHGGKSYDSKAILGAAHGYLPGQSAYGWDDFSGGKNGAAATLINLGFEVATPIPNPVWDRDEIILALALYNTNPASPPGKASAAVSDLSDLLNRLGKLKGRTGSDTFRNANGVYMKMMNLRAIDPAFVAAGKVGMKSGGALEQVVWNDYADAPQRLQDDAAAIRAAIIAETGPTLLLPALEPEYEGEEGGIVLAVHKRRERDAKLIRDKKKAAAAADDLICAVCNFDFAARYGEMGDGFIEVHHIAPVHLMIPGSKTKLSDLALLCANCHRMAHRRSPPLSIEDLKAVYTGS